MVEANRKGELDEEFSVLWVMGPDGPLINGSSGMEPSNGKPEITQGILNALESAGLLLQDIHYQTKTKQSGTKKNPRITETRSERSRRCTLTRGAYEAVDSDFVMPESQPASASFHFHGDVSQSIIGTQNRAELTNNIDFGNVREQIEREGGADRDELHDALNHVERLVERGEYLDRGALSRFSELMERHGWFTNAVMSALLGFATQIVT